MSMENRHPMRSGQRGSTEQGAGSPPGAFTQPRESASRSWRTGPGSSGTDGGAPTPSSLAYLAFPATNTRGLLERLTDSHSRQSEGAASSTRTDTPSSEKPRTGLHRTAHRRGWEPDPRALRSAGARCCPPAAQPPRWGFRTHLLFSSRLWKSKAATRAASRRPRSRSRSAPAASVPWCPRRPGSPGGSCQTGRGS